MPALRITGFYIPFPRANVDTDLILPARWMKTLGREGLGAGAFAALRGQPGNPFEDPRYAGAPILVGGANFGCGSSREHAVWALREIGVRAVIAPSFGAIFEANALRNFLVPVRLPAPAVERLLALGPGEPVTVDVGEETVSVAGESWRFALDPFRRHGLLHGIDDVDLALGLAPRIAAWEEQARRERPWEMVPGFTGEEEE